MDFYLTGPNKLLVDLTLNWLEIKMSPTYLFGLNLNTILETSTLNRQGHKNNKTLLMIFCENLKYNLLC